MTAPARWALLLLLAPVASARAGAGGVGWPLFRGDPGARGSVVLQGVGGEQARAWQFEVGSHVWGYQPGMSVWSSAAVGTVGGQAVVLVGSYDNNVYCLDALSGEKRWRFTTGGGVYATPVLWQGPRGPLVFAGSSDRLVYALDADLGRREWVYAVREWRPTLGGARLAAPGLGRVRGEDAVFVAHWVWDKSLSGSLQAGGLTALVARSGKHLWTTALGDNQLASPLFVAAGPRRWVYVASENGTLYALDADTGAVRWTHTDRHAIKGSPSALVTDVGPRIVIGSKFGVVRCLDGETGRELWRFKTAHWVDGTAAIALVAGREVAFVGSYDTNLYALDARRGDLLWSYRTAGGIYASPAVVEVSGRTLVLVSSWDHHLHGVDGETGRPLWKIFTGRPLWDSITLGDSIWASPTVAVLDGRAVAFLGSYAGPFHAIPLAEAARSGLARPGSNLGFWITMPAVTALITALTLLLTFRSRRRRHG